jgi:hypothetical protein
MDANLLQDDDLFLIHILSDIIAQKWAYVAIKIISPHILAIDPAKKIPPENNEFVYSITDFGDCLVTSKAEEMHNSGFSMCKLHSTIEKMICILIDRIRDEGGVMQGDTETEIQVEIDGYITAKRKCFEIIINLQENLVVNNFDPGVWGDDYLKNIKRLIEKGFGYPLPAPRRQIFPEKIMAGKTS